HSRNVYGKDKSRRQSLTVCISASGAGERRHSSIRKYPTNHAVPGVGDIERPVRMKNEPARVGETRTEPRTVDQSRLTGRAGYESDRAVASYAVDYVLCRVTRIKIPIRVLDEADQRASPHLSIGLVGDHRRHLPCRRRKAPQACGGIRHVKVAISPKSNRLRAHQTGASPNPVLLSPTVVASQGGYVSRRCDATDRRAAFLRYQQVTAGNEPKADRTIERSRFEVSILRECPAIGTRPTLKRPPGGL